MDVLGWAATTFMKVKVNLLHCQNLEIWVFLLTHPRMICILLLLMSQIRKDTLVQTGNRCAAWKFFMSKNNT